MDSVSSCLYDLVTVQSTPRDPDVYVGNAVPGRYGRIFGAQLLGESVMAASATVAPSALPTRFMPTLSRGVIPLFQSSTVLSGTVMADPSRCGRAEPGKMTPPYDGNHVIS